MYKVICFTDDQQGRDVELLMPLIYHAEKYLDCEVRFLFVWDIFALYRELPDLVILANTTGSKWNFEISMYAFEQNITLFALISEGIFRTDGSYNYYGYNTDKRFYQEFVCLWSEKTRSYLAGELPQIADRLVLTGATGFDRYKIYQFPSKEAFLQKYGLTKYRKTVGYAGWAFGKLYTETGRLELKYFLSEKPDSWKEWTEKQMSEVERILKQLIENNQDILFILKRHPNETHPHITRESRNEMTRLRNYPNVLYIKDEETIHDLISASDLWMGFNTTTAIEAWMLDKTTLLINPDPGFSRDPAFKGSLVAHNYIEAQAYLDEYYNTGKIQDFCTHEMMKNRDEIILDSIGFSDGLNHLRAAYYLNESLQKIHEKQRKRRFRFKYFLRSLLLHTGSLFYVRSLFLNLPRFKKTVWMFERHELKNIPVLKRKYYPYLDQFYEKNNLSTPVAQKKFWEWQKAGYNL